MSNGDRDDGMKAAEHLLATHRRMAVARMPGRVARAPALEPGGVFRLAQAVPLAVALAAALVLIFALSGDAAGQAPPPDARWLTFQTPNFQVVFHEGVDEVAFRAAERGERAIARLAGFGALPRERIQLVVTDHVDLSNGFARAAPYPRIVIWARPPVTGPGAIPFDDWLELVVTHEVVHILHLELTGPVGRLARLLTGRAPVAWPHFPAFALPSWAVEGVAVHSESAGTDGGRMHGARFDATLRARVLAGRGERIDQVMGSSPVFPGGERPYAWGGPFFHHLAEAEGEEAVGDFFLRQASRLNPLRLNATARETFGSSLEALHATWLDGLERDARDLEDAVRIRDLAPSPELLTTGARLGLYPAFRPGDGAMAWVRSDGLTEASIVLRDVHGEDRDVGPIHLASPLSWAADGSLWTTQPEYVDRYRIRSDLWRIDAEGVWHQVTHGLRVVAADAHPQGGPLAAVLEAPGTHRLVLLSEEGEVVRTLAEADPGVHWAHPRWSPDGTRIALTRWTAGGTWAVAVVDVGQSGPVVRIVSEGRAPVHGAAWTPDGEYLVWSSERSGVANLYVGEAGLSGGEIRQLSDLVTAGVFPTVAPDGRRVVFSLLTAEGWELAQLPLGAPRAGLPDDPRPEVAALGFAPLPLAPRHRAEPEHVGHAEGAMVEGHRAQLEGEVRPWSPLSTLRPRHWIPTLQSAQALGGSRVLAPTLGFESWAADAVDRHRWDLRVDFPLGGPGRRWEGAAAWRWAGLGTPVLAASVGQRWDALSRVQAPGASDAAPEAAPGASSLLYLASRERSAAVSASLLRPRFRSAHQALLDLSGIRQELHVLEAGGSVSTRAVPARPVRDFVQLGTTLTRSTARSYAFHPSPQEGSQVTLRLRARRETSVPDSLRGVAGRDASLVDAVLSIRHFRPLGDRGMRAAGGAPPVLALRGAAGAAEGPGAGATTLRIGGGGGGGGGVLGATWDRVPGLFQVRGYEAGARGGDRAWGAGAEVRVPLAIVHRGSGVLPVHADRVAGTLWVDGAGVAGTVGGVAAAGGEGSAGRTLASLGAEVAVVHALFFQSPALLRVGVALPVAGLQLIGDGGAAGAAGSGWRRPGASVYAAIGWSF
ncbi:hypothetical protein BH23GEM11_BH23GEM11_04800 [soil metagenome]